MNNVHIRGLLGRISLGLLLGSLSDAVGANGLINLGFEEGHRDFSPGFVSAEEALPGWTVTLDGVPSDIVYEDLQLTGSSIQLAQRTNPPEGNYRLALANGGPIPQISQFGVIPFASTAFEFYGVFFGEMELTEILINEELQNLVSLGQEKEFAGRIWSLVGVDVSDYSGDEVELAIRVLGSGRPDAISNQSGLLIDALRFTDRVIPEPSIIGLLGAAFCFLCVRRASCRTRAGGAAIRL